MNALPIHIGWDAREAIAADVCRFSLLRRSTIPLHVRYLKLDGLRNARLYSRESWQNGGQRFDVIDEKPFSTDFSFSRFLVPALCQYDGWALAVDCDFLFLADIAELFALRDDRYAVMVCKQDHQPIETTKMDNQIQTAYPRKNWSSLMLFNCAHEATRGLTPFDVNNRPGSYLHRLEWCPDEAIGALPPQWNFIDGTTAGEPKAVHYSAGGPWFDGYRDVRFAGEWFWTRDEMQRRQRVKAVA